MGCEGVMVSEAAYSGVPHAVLQAESKRSSLLNLHICNV